MMGLVELDGEVQQRQGSQETGGFPVPMVAILPKRTREEREEGEEDDTTTPSTYTIKPGDTLAEIAVKMGVTVDELMEINGIDDPDVIIAGRVLTLPSRRRTAGEHRQAQ